jgi:hypothetical protein
MPVLWGKPRLESQHPLWLQVRCHAANGVFQLVERLDVANGTEKACHDIELLSKGEVGHVAKMKVNTGDTSAGDFEQLWADIQTFDAEVLGKVLKVKTGAARDVK